MTRVARFVIAAALAVYAAVSVAATDDAPPPEAAQSNTQQ